MTRGVLRFLLVLYAAARVLQVFSGNPPPLWVVAIHVVTPMAFALVHGSTVYRVRGILIFTAVCLVVGNVFENVGVVTGFPFGRYYFTGVMGPKFFHVPVLLGLAYIGIGYCSWMVATLIAGNRHRLIVVPLTAAVVMTLWDAAQDPVWSTVLRAWVWLDGGPYFGVPLSNFFGWLLTSWAIFQAFAIYERGCEPSLADRRPAAIFYGICAAGNLLVLIPLRRVAAVSDAAGHVWTAAAIAVACMLSSVLMLGFGVAGYLRFAGSEAGGNSPAA